METVPIDDTQGIAETVTISHKSVKDLLVEFRQRWRSAITEHLLILPGHQRGKSVRHLIIRFHGLVDYTPQRYSQQFFCRGNGRARRSATTVRNQCPA